MKLTRIVQAVGLLGLSLPQVVQAQAASQRVEITGSSIKRIQDEGALPLQVIKAADLIKQGVTSVEQLLGTLASNGNGLDNMASNQGVQIELPPRVRGSSPVWADWDHSQMVPPMAALIDGLVAAATSWTTERDAR